MKSVSSKIYTKEYYLESCLGSEEFSKFSGKKVHPSISEYSHSLKISYDTKALDLGTGRGDLALEIARKGATVIGIDYSKDGIELAKKALRVQSETLRKRVSFYVMNAKKLSFEDNTFDIVTAIDVFEHLYKDELEIAIKEISRVLKPGGKLLMHTGTNKIYLDFTHKYWCFPVSSFLVKANEFLTKRHYENLPRDPRNDLHKKQHVNEPTYAYLKNLFERNNFKGKINSSVPYKPLISWKDKIYNLIVLLYPFSKYYPVKLFFESDYVCVMRNIKSEVDFKRS